MISEVIEQIVSKLQDSGLAATADARNVDPPGCFVTINRLERPTLADDYALLGSVVCLVRDLGGMADVDAISDMVDQVIKVLQPLGAEFLSIELNQQATLPSGGTMPAAHIMFRVYAEMEQNNGN